MLTFELNGLDELLAELVNRGYNLLGPTLQDKAVVVDTISSVKDLPAGWGDQQDAGTYSLARRSDQALFGYVIGPVAWKKYLSPPRTRLAAFRKEGKGFVAIDQQATASPRPLAFIGVRSCELKAIELYDRVFLNGPYVDTRYAARRSSLCTVSVDCMSPGGTCFCASMGTGPSAREGFDIALTEIVDGEKHLFVARSGSDRGVDLLKQVKGRPPSTEELALVNRQRQAAMENLRRRVNLPQVSARLPDLFEHAMWDELAHRCLACTNCTMVCPTCFCSTVDDVTDLGGATAERWKRWDSCFVTEYSKVAGGNTRPSIRARYRQWLMHKFSYWNGQFGSPGCVGCGRCITWCPVGIDITAVLEAMTGDEQHSQL
jgi:sulfhydrogenase subunit beta (sulfur reductase)